mgnify:CR=1 FL=1|tara:strand:- start:834 stop:1310 length:477 start_codon:yes stop_codon:yes gene_type:complete
MANLIVYFQKNYKGIYLVTWALFMFLVIFTIYNVQFPLLKHEEEQDKKKKEERSEIVSILYEGQEGQVKEGFCNSGKNIATQCGKLKKGGAAACVMKDCCVWAQSKNKKGKNLDYCVEGTSGGPELNQDYDGNNFYRFIHKEVKKKGDNIINWQTFTG